MTPSLHFQTFIRLIQISAATSTGVIPKARAFTSGQRDLMAITRMSGRSCAPDDAFPPFPDVHPTHPDFDVSATSTGVIPKARAFTSGQGSHGNRGFVA